MDFSFETPQRVAIVIEKNKCETWSVGAYLVTADGQRDRRSLGVFESYDAAAKSLKQVWQQAEL